MLFFFNVQTWTRVSPFDVCLMYVSFDFYSKKTKDNLGGEREKKITKTSSIVDCRGTLTQEISMTIPPKASFSHSVRSPNPNDFILL